MTGPWVSTEFAARRLGFTDTGGPDGTPNTASVRKWIRRYVRREEQKQKRRLIRHIGRSVRIHIDALEIGA